jgi:hypothetical protein
MDGAHTIMVVPTKEQPRILRRCAPQDDELMVGSCGTVEAVPFQNLF